MLYGCVLMSVGTWWSRVCMAHWGACGLQRVGGYWALSCLYLRAISAEHLASGISLLCEEGVSEPPCTDLAVPGSIKGEIELGQLEDSMRHQLLAPPHSLFFPKNVKLVTLNEVVNVHG